MVKRRTLKTAESNYEYRVAETVDMVGDSYYAVTVPCPRDRIRRSCGKWANAKLVKEVLEDFGLTEERREYRENGETVVYGY